MAKGPGMTQGDVSGTKNGELSAKLRGAQEAPPKSTSPQALSPEEVARARAQARCAAAFDGSYD